jgi:uncharacterized protein YajQ (UPF0234 family)
MRHAQFAITVPGVACMAQQNSFDVSTGADLQEVDNAVNQAMKEIQQRYDFKGTHCSITFDRKTSALTLEADDDFKLRAVYDVLQSKFAKRGVPLKNLKPGTPEPASGGRMRQVLSLTQGIPTDTAREISKAVRGLGIKRVQIQIQGDELRVSSPSRDDLQEVMRFLRGRDWGVELNFGNYR